MLCKRPPTPREVAGFVFKGMARDGVTAMYVEAGREFNNGRLRRPDAQPRPTRSARSPTKSASPEWLSENYPRLLERFDAERREALAEVLQLPTSAMDALCIGWWPDRRWWNPETHQEEGEPGC